MTAEKQKKYDEKLNRIYTTFEHKEPDRVPINVGGGIFAVTEAGYTVKECIYDTSCQKGKDAVIKFLEKYDQDFAFMPVGYTGEGPMMDIIAPKFMAWSGRPGYNIPDNSIQQFMEHPPLEDEDFDMFFDRTYQWALTKCQPTLCELYEPMKNLRGPISSRMPRALAEEFAKPEMREMIQKCWQVADMYKEFGPKMRQALKDIADAGYPSIGGGKAAVPYDEWGDEFRGSLQCITDLYENPEQVERFIDQNQEEMIDRIKHMNPDGSKDGKLVHMTLHRGMDGFLSGEFYQKYYWRHLQEIIEAIMSVNMIPSVFCEGHYETRLDLLKDIPKGRILYQFEYTPMDVVKKELGDIATITGGFPVAQLYFEKKENVVDNVKKIIDDCAPGGGFIFRTSAGLDNVKKENVEAMYDTLMTYGKYR